MKNNVFFVLLALVSLACVAQSALPEPTTEVEKSGESVEMVVIASRLNIRADSNEKSPADPQGLKQGDVVKVYLTCTGGEMRDWLAINRDCTKWVKASWLEYYREITVQ